MLLGVKHLVVVFWFVQKLGVVNEYLMAVDKTADGGSGQDLVREVAEEVERKSDYASCRSDSPKLHSSASSSTSSSSLDSDDIDDDDWMI